MAPDSPFTTTILAPPGSSISKPRSTLAVREDTPTTFIDAMAVRSIVFVDEQGCSAEEELDDDDARSWHWVMYAQPPPPPSASTESNGTVATPGDGESKPVPIGVIRLVPPPHAPHSYEPTDATGEGPCNEDLPYIKITRVAVLPAYRGKGLSRALVDTVLDWASQHADELSSAISSKGERWDGLTLVHAQISVERLYEKMGFVTDKSMGTWVEEGIDHIAMWKRVRVD